MQGMLSKREKLKDHSLHESRMLVQPTPTGTAILSRIEIGEEEMGNLAILLLIVAAATAIQS